jgi:hypothetical protein
MIKYVLAGVGAGAASALYLAYSYHPILLHDAIHAFIFSSGLIAMYLAKTLTASKSGYYIAGALPVHLALHYFVVKDLASLIGTGVSQALNFGSLP